jgi:hypothetical protein
MRCADGGKIDTVLYSAACGALNSSEWTGTEAPNRAQPARARTYPHDREALRVPADRRLRFVNPIAASVPARNKSHEKYLAGLMMPRQAA